MTCWLRRLFFIGYKYVFFVCDNAGRRTFHGIFRVNFSLFMTRGENSLHSKKKGFSSDDCFAALVFAISF